MDGNVCTVNDEQRNSIDYIGFHILGVRNLVVRNSARGGFAGTLLQRGYVFADASNNSYGPEISLRSGEITSTSPWANFRD